jgi:hypothetical protein
MGLTPSAIAFLILATACGIVSAYLTFREIEEVNRKLPQREHVEYAFMYPGKMKGIGLAYKEFYPQGTTNRWRVVFQTLAFLFLGLTAVAAGFLR